MAKTVIIIGSYAPWMYRLRKNLICELISRKYTVVAVAPKMDGDVFKELESEDEGEDDKQIRT